MKLSINFFLLFLVTLVTCKSRDNNKPSSVTQIPSETQNKEDRVLPFLDTVIHLQISKDQHKSNVPITNVNARKAFYKYFKAKGVLSREDTKISQDSVNNKLCVDYDTIYHIKGDMFGGAIVSYWIGPPDLNGHCFQPSKAFIQATTHGYLISNENFIHSNFTIDSSLGSYVYGYDYDCGGKGIVRRFKLTLK